MFFSLYRDQIFNIADIIAFKRVKFYKHGWASFKIENAKVRGAEDKKNSLSYF